MNVRELIDELLLLPEDLEIISSEDDEGNGYNKVYGVEMVYADVDTSGYYIDSVRSLSDCGEGCDENEWDDCDCESYMQLRVLIF